MVPIDANRRQPFTSDSVEPSSWWLFPAIVLGAVGCYAALAVHLILAATNASVLGLVWMAIPVLFSCTSAAALFMGSGMGGRERLAAVRAALVGYSPRDRSACRESTPRTKPTGSVD